MRPRLRAAPALLLVAACSAGPPRAPGLLLVTIDTLRVERVGCYGHDRPTTPHLDRLAAEGVRVAEAYAAAPITAPSHATILTGRWPLEHGVLTNGLYALAAGETTLAELLRERGFATAAFVGAVPLDHRFGFAQGFEVYDDDFSSSELRGKDLSPWYRIPLAERERRAGEVVTPALAWLSALPPERPFLLWVHLFDPHSPYDPPASEARRFEPPGDPTDPSNPSLVELRRAPREWHAWLAGITDAAWVRGRYDGEVAYADRELGRLLAGLDRLGLAARTAVAVTADHGEAFGEHGEWFFHGDLVHEPAVRVPLVLRAPWRLPRGRVARVRARGVDLLPTLLELVGVPVPAGVSGESLAEALADGREELRPVLLQAAFRDHSGRGIFGYIEGRHKIVWRDAGERGPGQLDCYDLARDPRELWSDCNRPAAPFAPMRERFEALRRALESPAARAEGVSGEVLEALRSLGYVGE